MNRVRLISSLRRFATAVVLAASFLVAPIGGAAAGAAATEGRYFKLVDPASFSYSPGAGGNDGTDLRLWSTGAATAYVDLAETTLRMDFNARAEQCDGLPRLEVAVDSWTLMARDIAGTGQYAVVGTWAPGRHKVTFRYRNDFRSADCDRNLRISFVGFTGRNSNGTVAPIYTVQTLLPRYATVLPADAGVTAPQARLWTNGTLAFELDNQNSREIDLVVAGTYCEGMPSLRLRVDGELAWAGVIPLPGGNGVDSRIVIPGTWNYKTLHDVTIEMYNELRTDSCDRSVTIKEFSFAGWT